MLPVRNLPLGKMQDIWLPVKSLIDQDNKVHLQAHHLSLAFLVSLLCRQINEPKRAQLVCSTTASFFWTFFAVVRRAAHPLLYVVILPLLHQLLHESSILNKCIDDCGLKPRVHDDNCIFQRCRTAARQRPRSRARRSSTRV